MKKKIVFRRVDARKYEGCRMMPAGAIEGEGKERSFITTPPTDMSDWLGSPMEEVGFFPEVKFPEIEFGLAAAEVSWREFVLTVKCKNAAPEEVIKVLQGSATDVSSVIRQEIEDTFDSLVRTEVRRFVETANAGGYFLGPFTVGAGLRLTDGRLLTLPSSRLMIPSASPLSVGILSANKTGDNTILRCVVLAQPSMICFRIIEVGAFSELISSVEIIATEPAPVWNSSSQSRLSGITSIPLTGAGTYKEGGRLTDVNVTRPVYRGGNITRGWNFYGVGNPMNSVGQLKEWYRLYELPLTSGKTGKWTLINPGVSLTSLYKKNISPDFTCVQVPQSGLTYEAGSRIVVISPKITKPSPFLNPLPVEYDPSGNPFGVKLKEIILKTISGVGIRCYPEKDSYVRLSDEWLQGWRYPEVGIRRIIFCYTNDSSGAEKSIGYPMADDRLSGSSFILGEGMELSDAELAGLRDEASELSATSRVDEGVLLDWSKGTDPIGTPESRLSFDGERLVGVCRVIPGTSAEQTPSLYLFSTGGIRIISRKGDEWKIERYLSPEKCIGPFSIVETADSAIVMTETGLNRLVNNIVSPISVPVSGTSTEILSSLPGAEDIVGAISSEGELLEKLREGRLYYNPEANHLGVYISRGFLLYDLSKGSWITSASGNGKDGWILTYPFDLASARIRSIEFFGCEMEKELSVFLYSSDTLGKWRLSARGYTRRGRFGPICGSGARFHRLLIVGYAPEGAWITI